MRFSVRVKPGASRTRVGGSYGDPPALVVAVTARAVDGRANAAVVEALADVLGVRKGAVEIVRGSTSRSKLIAVDDPTGDVAQALSVLLRA